MIEKPRQKKQRHRLSRHEKIFWTILVVAVVSAGLRAFLVTPFRVNDTAMQNGLYAGDCLLSSQTAYKNSSPQAGDLILFEHPLRAGDKLIRRVIATAGQAVEISGKTVYVNGAPVQDGSAVLHSDYRVLPRDFSGRDFSGPTLVPPGSVYVLGDNRDQAEDSRNFGCVPEPLIQGKLLFVYFSWAPDPNAPELKSPYIIPALHLLFYNLVSFPSRVRWDRFFI